MRRKFLTVVFTAMMVFTMSMTALAGQWTSDGNDWRYDKTGTGNFATSEWLWIDGNNDGISECYCFDGTSFMYASTTTPDGYTVDENGAWTVDGVVQTKNAEAQATETQFTEQISSEVPDVAGTYAGSGIICIIANEGNHKFWVECDLGKDYLPSYAGNGVFASPYMRYSFSGNTLIIEDLYGGDTYQLVKR